jgi:hypothetical protein
VRTITLMQYEVKVFNKWCEKEMHLLTVGNVESHLKETIAWHSKLTQAITNGCNMFTYDVGCIIIFTLFFTVCCYSECKRVSVCTVAYNVYFLTFLLNCLGCSIKLGNCHLQMGYAEHNRSCTNAICDCH